MDPVCCPSRKSGGLWGDFDTLSKTPRNDFLLSHYHHLIQFGESKRAASVNYFMPFMCAGSRDATEYEYIYLDMYRKYSLIKYSSNLTPKCHNLPYIYQATIYITGLWICSHRVCVAVSPCFHLLWWLHLLTYGHVHLYISLSERKLIIVFLNILMH